MKFDFNKIDDDVSLSDRGFEPPITHSTNVGTKGNKLKESFIKTSKLTESTSNFKSMSDLPLLVFVTEDEIEWDENGEPVDTNLAEFLLYDEAVDNLKDFLAEQNSKIAQKAMDVADQAWDLRINLESEDDEHDNNDKWAQLEVLEDEADYINDCKFELRSGYYQGYQIYMDDECFALLNDENKAFIKQLFNEIKNEFELHEIGVSYRMSNGETGYHKIDESYSKSDAITAIMDAYGCSNKQAEGALQTLEPDTIEDLIKGFKERAKTSFYKD